MRVLNCEHGERGVRLGVGDACTRRWANVVAPLAPPARVVFTAFYPPDRDMSSGHARRFSAGLHHTRWRFAPLLCDRIQRFLATVREFPTKHMYVLPAAVTLFYFPGGRNVAGAPPLALPARITRACGRRRGHEASGGFPSATGPDATPGFSSLSVTYT